MYLDRDRSLLIGASLQLSGALKCFATRRYDAGNTNNGVFCAAELVCTSRTPAQQLETVSNKIRRVSTRKRVGERRVLTPARDSEDPGSGCKLT